MLGESSHDEGGSRGGSTGALGPLVALTLKSLLGIIRLDRRHNDLLASRCILSTESAAAIVKLRPLKSKSRPPVGSQRKAHYGVRLCICVDLCTNISVARQDRQKTGRADGTLDPGCVSS